MERGERLGWVIGNALVLMGAVLLVHSLPHRDGSTHSIAAHWSQDAKVPKPPSITVHNAPGVCVRVTHVSVDSGLIIQVKRICGEAGDYMELHWTAADANGIILSRGYTNFEAMDVPRGESTAWKPGEFKSDPRIANISVWTENY